MANALLSFTAWVASWLPVPFKRGLYRLGPFSRLLRGALNRAAPQGLTTVEIAAGSLAGFRLVLDLSREKDYWLGTYEPHLQSAIEDLVRPGMVVYDVGANIGYISLLLANVVGERGQVFAFEALPANLERVRANLSLNPAGERVLVVEAAVIETTRPATFLVGPSGGMGKAAGSAGRREYTYDKMLEVNGVSLDQFVNETGAPVPQVVKMDIEGGEILALPGMQRALSEAPPLIFLELHGGEAAQAAWKILSSAGYRICEMKPGYPRIPSIEALDWKAYIVAFPPDYDAG
jgi:FkbM family methyltransferase